MALQCGIVGLPNVGKSTLFNALTAAKAEAQNYPFCTIEPNIGVVALPDPRLQAIAQIFKPEKILPTSVEFVDIAGLVKGASQGEGLGNQFLGNIRSVDAIVEVLRCFEDPDVVHVHGDVDPLRDIEVIHTELALADLDSVQRRMDKLTRSAKAGDKQAAKQVEVFNKVQAALSAGKAVRQLGLSAEELALQADACLLTAKPLFYAGNVGENEIKAADSPALQALRKYTTQEGAELVVFSGKIEAELASLAPDERAAFLEELGLSSSGLDRLAQAAYRCLGLMTFFTAGPKEVRAWTIQQNTAAPQAAGVIHSDFEKHFIRAEVYHYDDLIKYGSEAKVREAGKLRVEGKDYILKDGDILYFRTSA